MTSKYRMVKVRSADRDTLLPVTKDGFVLLERRNVMSEPTIGTPDNLLPREKSVYHVMHEDFPGRKKHYMLINPKFVFNGNSVYKDSKDWDRQATPESLRCGIGMFGFRYMPYRDIPAVNKSVVLAKIIPGAFRSREMAMHSYEGYTAYIIAKVEAPVEWYKDICLEFNNMQERYANSLRKELVKLNTWRDKDETNRGRHESIGSVTQKIWNLKEPSLSDLVRDNPIIS